MNRKKFIILISSVFFILVIALISFKFYPIVFVNWQPIFYADLSKNYKAALVYYEKVVTTYNNGNADIMNSLEVRDEIKRAGIESLIEDILISNELKEIFSNSELKNQINKNISAVIDGKDIKKEIETLYGLSSEEFIECFLEPQARKEILEARLRMENINFNEWLKSAKFQAKVINFFPGFEWKNGTMILKK